MTSTKLKWGGEFASTRSKLIISNKSGTVPMSPAERSFSNGLENFLLTWREFAKQRPMKIV